MKKFVLASMILLLSGPLMAEALDVALTRQLAAQGYEGIEVSYTLLGRLRIDARKGAARREIVINPTTGEILRDYVTQAPRYTVAGQGGDDHGDTPAAVASGAVSDLMDPVGTAADVRQDAAE